MTIYFDHNATTPMHPEVFEAMRPWLTERHGNASSLHRAGREARAAIDAARAQVAECVAELKGVDVAELARITRDNFFTLFNKAQP